MNPGCQPENRPQSAAQTAQARSAPAVVNEMQRADRARVAPNQAAHATV